MRISAVILGRQKLLARWEMLKTTLVPKMRDSMLRHMAMLAEYVRAEKLSGQVLRNITGTLRRSIHPDAQVEGTKVTGIVGTNVEYAKVHERGGTFHIKEHERMQTQAFGRPMVPRMVTVSAHNATFPKRAFLLPSLQEKRDDLLKGLTSDLREMLNAA